jgi:hypothetical protein
MCCFSGNVRSVNDTKIFARLTSPEEQAIAYSMSLDTPEDVAMILPIPVIPGSKEDSVKFIDLSGYQKLFADLNDGFPAPKSRYANAAGSLFFSEKKAAPLKVQNVGSFEASFVPTIKDFARLDKRFKLPDGTWEKIPVYKDFGFAVFKLKKGKLKVHPMAFTFPSSFAAKGRLFFPTVHIHDGKIHRLEDFDHQLFAQTWSGAGLRSKEGWRESPELASKFTKPKQSKGLIWSDGHVYLREVRGRQTNRDIVAQAVRI